MEEVETPSTTTIQALADFLNMPLAKTAKAVFYKGDSGRFVFAVIRGDLDVNETKLRKAVRRGRTDTGHCRGDPGNRRGTGVRLAGRRARRADRHRRERAGYAKSGGGS